MQAQFEEQLQEEREEAVRRQEVWQAQLEAQQAALEENQTLLRATQEEVKAMNNKFDEVSSMLRSLLKFHKD
jgi:chromosome segregation ATPase